MAFDLYRLPIAFAFLASLACKPSAPDADLPDASSDGGDDTDGHSDGGDPPDPQTSGSTTSIDLTTGAPDPNTASDPGSTTVPPDPTDATSTSPPDPTGPDNGCGDGDGDGLVSKPEGLLEPLADDFPGDIDALSGEFGGVISLGIHRNADDDEWLPFARASFFDIPDPDTSFTCGVELDPLTGPDDCGVRYFGGFGWGGGSYEPHMAGDVTFHGPGFSEAMTVENNYYILDLDAADHTPEWGEAYGASWTGESPVPASELPQLVTVPPELLVTAPAGAWQWSAADFALTWTGTSDGLIPLHVIFTADPRGGSEWFEVRCAMVDDGAFTVPAAVIALLPAWSGHASMFRRNTATDTVGDRQILGSVTVSLAIDVEVSE